METAEAEIGFLSRWIQPVGLPDFQIQASDGFVSTVNYDPLNPYIPPPCASDDWWCRHELETTLGVVSLLSFGIPFAVVYGPAAVATLGPPAIAYGERLVQRAEQIAYSAHNWSMYHPQETVLAYNVAETAVECTGGGCTLESAAVSVLFGSMLDDPQGFTYGGIHAVGPDPEDILARETLLAGADDEWVDALIGYGDAGDLLAGSYAQLGMRVNNLEILPDTARKVTVELGPGTGENLINIANSRPHSSVVGIDRYPRGGYGERDIARFRVSMAEMEDQVLIVKGNYTQPPLNPIADEVIAVAPGGLHEDVNRAIGAAANIVKPSGEIYMITDLDTFVDPNSNYFNTAMDILDGVLTNRGLDFTSQYGPANADAISRGVNPIGIPLQTIHSSTSYLYVQVNQR